jgi:alanine racemase
MEYIIEKVLLDSEKHEANIVCSGNSYLITQTDFESLGLSEGETLDEERFEQLCEADNKLSCIKKAFTHLSYGDMSAKKLTDKLCAKFDKQIVSEIIELLKKHGYLNDTSLAGKYAKSFYEFKHWGPGRIKSDLYARGFSKEISIPHALFWTSSTIVNRFLS